MEYSQKREKNDRNNENIWNFQDIEIYIKFFIQETIWNNKNNENIRNFGNIVISILRLNQGLVE